MRKQELQQIYARFFNPIKSPPLYEINNPFPVYTGNEKTIKRYKERHPMQMLWDSRILKGGIWVGRTFVGSVRDTFGLRKSIKK